MLKKWMNYGIVTVLIIAIVWTISTNLFQTKNSINQSIIVGSYDIEFAEENNTKSLETNEHIETENHQHDGDEIHSHDDHEHEHEENVVDSHLDHEHEGHSHEINTTEVVEVSNPAHQFVTKTLDGETVNLSDFVGKQVIINFWTTWCPPCQEEIPELQKFYEESMDKNEVVLLGINITNEDLGVDVIRDFRDYYGITYPILLDETGEITDSYEIITIPTTYIIDEKGNFKKQILGPLTDEMLNELITK